MLENPKAGSISRGRGGRTRIVTLKFSRLSIDEMLYLVEYIKSEDIGFP
jgi:hypothetical protein